MDDDAAGFARAARVTRMPADESSRVREVLHAAVGSVGGVERPGQVEMAEAVAAAMKEERHLLVQAGTGTGKSLGYLVPSLLHGKRVVIATATLGLQHQLVQRDIPALLEGAADVLDEVPSHAVLKGRSNYACLHRLRVGVPDDQGTLVDVPEGTLGAEVVALREWAEDQAENTGPGDRESAPSHTDRGWRQVSVTARECLGASKCGFALECFAEKAKAKAHAAQLVVTNHSLLAIDAQGDVPTLPEHDVVVIDEAHELASRVTQAATVELEPVSVERAARRARGHLKSGQAADDLADASDALADVLTRTEHGRIDRPTDELLDVLGLVRDSARACMSDFSSEKGGGEPDAARQQARGLVDDVRAVAERMAAHSDADVLWAAESRSGPRLQLAPLDVASMLANSVFADRTVVLTSATLALGGSFDAVVRSVGLGFGDHEWTGIDVGSPFDYGKQGMLYVAKHLPAPGREGPSTQFVDELVELVGAAGGRTLGLFSSRRGAEAAAEKVRERLPDIEVLVQGEAHLSELTKKFVDDETACLFGTLGLWQGFDVPGATCQLVVIDRIPFPRPDDPLMGARQRLVEQRGGNGFMSIAASHAALLLAQGAGRLIRRVDDRGVVAVLDSRLATARYGGYLASSLPPMWRTTDKATVLAALRRLDELATQA